jgi:hypothetical protein
MALTMCLLNITMPMQLQTPPGPIMCSWHPLPRYPTHPPTHPNPSITIQFIEFIYTNNRYPEDKINAKITKYLPLINDIQMKGWKVAPLIVIIVDARGTTHNPVIQTLRTAYKFKKSETKKTLININTIAIQHLSSIILHKRRLENNQPLPIT